MLRYLDCLPSSLSISQLLLGGTRSKGWESIFLTVSTLLENTPLVGEHDRFQTLSDFTAPWGTLIAELLCLLAKGQMLTIPPHAGVLDLPSGYGSYLGLWLCLPSRNAKIKQGFGQSKQTVGQPLLGEYSIGYTNPLFEFRTAIWIGIYSLGCLPKVRYWANLLPSPAIEKRWKIDSDISIQRTNANLNYDGSFWIPWLLQRGELPMYRFMALHFFPLDEDSRRDLIRIQYWNPEMIEIVDILEIWHLSRLATFTQLLAFSHPLYENELSS
ncbi:P-loop containing nucleoside triphosphatehydrolases superfamily protein [Striga asiatica]|uniref:P-loop containing nucleoside triphosphatehydrolases superfamily protein n=1 Tax=Striga asiatica TaxID=4170 RepID=A0A5A7PZQ1_STRAF|nr:P-loop containing nucleoside triphosphatehydrolases superfamily protein [Striga asiatica]